jgi:hypothetical protein
MSELNSVESIGSFDLEQSESNFDVLFKECQELNIYIPNWVNKRFSNLYKFAYLQVKKDEGCHGMSSANRTKLIKNLMEMYFKKIVENAQENNSQEA